jgi:branched-chain amino acid aminotransferase
MTIEIHRTTNPKTKPNFSDANSLGFGKIFTDHMFVMDYDEKNGWHDAKIVPYGKENFEPSVSVMHYGQTVWEGMKAYKNKDGGILLFRPYKNFERLNNSAERLNMPKIDPDFQLEALKALLAIDSDWVPEGEASLYIRPIMVGTEEHIGLHSSATYRFYIICSPSGAYASLDPCKIMVEEEFVRAVPGGTGFAKTAGNYASSILAQARAAQKGYFQVLWLDGIERKYVEEVGSMNIFFKIDGTVVTPMLNGSILPGVTRASIIEMLRDMGQKVEERRISIDEVFAAADAGKLEECFGTGTAAVISPVGILGYKGRDITINNNKIGTTSQKAYDNLTKIQRAILPDKFGWTMLIN